MVSLEIDYIYFAELEMLLNYGVGYPNFILSLRERIHQEGLEESPYVIKADRKLFQNVHRFIEIMESSDEPLEDDESQPIEKWWWHLHKVAKGNYPSLKLKEYLREIYRKRRKHWRQKSRESHLLLEDLKSKPKYLSFLWKR
jgi:hypothetical protein